MNCRYAYLENKHEPKYSNELLGDNNAAKVVANIYQDHIGSGKFWEVADDIIADYFDDSIDHEVAKNMVRHAAGFLLMWINRFRSIHASLSLVVARKDK